MGICHPPQLKKDPDNRPNWRGHIFFGSETTHFWRLNILIHTQVEPLRFVKDDLHICIYVYVYMYMYICICIYVHIHIYIYTYAYTYK